MHPPSPYPPAGPIRPGPPQRSPVLGILSLIIQAVALLLVAAVAYGFIAIATGAPAFGVVEVYPLTVGPGVASMIVGLLGAVLAIIAIATRRGRRFGVIALVLVPVGWLVAFAGLLGSYLLG